MERGNKSNDKASLVINLFDLLQDAPSALALSTAFLPAGNHLCGCLAMPKMCADYVCPAWAGVGSTHTHLTFRVWRFTYVLLYVNTICSHS